MIIRGRKGSHVGVIISFAVFVTFLSFLYIVIQPAVSKQRDKQSLVDFLETELTDKFTIDMTSVSVSGTGTCLSVDSGPIGTNGLNAIVKDSNGPVHQTNGNPLEFAYAGGLYKIYYSSEPFNSQQIGFYDGCPSASIGQVRTDSYIFQSKINSTIQEYNANYDNLKKELNIPLGSDFSYYFIAADNVAYGTKEKNVSTSVYSKEYLIQYVDSQANIKSGKLRIKVW